jgi:type VI protein secretion system component VasF
MDQRPRSQNLAKDDYIDRYQDGRGLGLTAVLLAFAALLIAGWLLLSMRVDDRTNHAENAPTAIGPAYRAPATGAAPQTSTPATKP